MEWIREEIMALLERTLERKEKYQEFYLYATNKEMKARYKIIMEEAKILESQLREILESEN